MDTTPTDDTKYNRSDSVWPTHLSNLIRQSKQKEKRDYTLWPEESDCHVLFFMLCGQRRRENTSYSNTPKTKDNTVIGKGASEDPTRPCEWKPQKSSILVGSAQRNLLLSSQRDRRMANCSRNKFPKSYPGRPRHLKGTVFHPGTLSSYKHDYDPLPYGLNPIVSSYP